MQFGDFAGFREMVGLLAVLVLGSRILINLSQVPQLVFLFPITALLYLLVPITAQFLWVLLSIDIYGKSMEAKQLHSLLAFLDLMNELTFSFSFSV